MIKRTDMREHFSLDILSFSTSIQVQIFRDMLGYTTNNQKHDILREQDFNFYASASVYLPEQNSKC